MLELIGYRSIIDNCLVARLTTQAGRFRDVLRAGVGSEDVRETIPIYRRGEVIKLLGRLYYLFRKGYVEIVVSLFHFLFTPWGGIRKNSR